MPKTMTTEEVGTAYFVQRVRWLTEHGEPLTMEVFGRHIAGAICQAVAAERERIEAVLTAGLEHAAMPGMVPVVKAIIRGETG